MTSMYNYDNFAILPWNIDWRSVFKDTKLVNPFNKRYSQDIELTRSQYDKVVSDAHAAGVAKGVNVGRAEGAVEGAKNLVNNTLTGVGDTVAKGIGKVGEAVGSEGLGSLAKAATENSALVGGGTIAALALGANHIRKKLKEREEMKRRELNMSEHQIFSKNNKKDKMELDVDSFFWKSKNSMYKPTGASLTVDSLKKYGYKGKEAFINGAWHYIEDIDTKKDSNGNHVRTKLKLIEKNSGDKSRFTTTDKFHKIQIMDPNSGFGVKSFDYKKSKAPVIAGLAIGLPVAAYVGKKIYDTHKELKKEKELEEALKIARSGGKGKSSDREVTTTAVSQAHKLPVNVGYESHAPASVYAASYIAPYDYGAFSLFSEDEDTPKLIKSITKSITSMKPGDIVIDCGNIMGVQSVRKSLNNGTALELVSDSGKSKIINDRDNTITIKVIKSRDNESKPVISDTAISLVQNKEIDNEDLIKLLSGDDIKESTGMDKDKIISSISDDEDSTKAYKLLNLSDTISKIEKIIKKNGKDRSGMSSYRINTV